MSRSLLFITFLLFATGVFADRVIHREKSLYRNILVTQQGDRRCLAFSVKRERRNQTCMNLKHPEKIVFPYVRMTFAGLMANPNPKNMLMIGLGGGTIASVLMEIYPDLKMDLVEVDEAVVKVAHEFFDFKATGNANVLTLDGRVFVRRALVGNQKYDLIILDAYNGDYIPEHLMTREFLTDVKALLTDNGIVVANTFAVSKLYDHESVTYREVFGPFINLKMPGTGNRVVIAGHSALPKPDTFRVRSGQLQPRLLPYGVNLARFLPYLDRETDWDTSARPLTDQYSPANLLRGR